MEVARNGFIVGDLAGVTAHPPPLSTAYWIRLQMDMRQVHFSIHLIGEQALTPFLLSPEACQLTTILQLTGDVPYYFGTTLYGLAQMLLCLID